MRIQISIALTAVCLLVAGCSALRVNQAQINGDEAWPTEGESPLRGNAVKTTLTPPLEERWAFNAGAGFGSVSPLIIDEVVFVATRKGEVHAIEMETGRRLGQSEFGDTIEGTPVYDDGMLFVPVGWGRRALIGYDLLRGSSVWKVKGAPINAGLLIYSDVVIAADDESSVRAYHKSDGEIVWETSLGEGAGVIASPLLAGELLIVADDRGHVAALNPDDGSLVWSTTVDAPVHSPPASNGAAIFIPTTRGRLVALNLDDGSQDWTFSLDSHESYVASPAVSDGQIVFGASDGNVRSLEAASGDLQWSSSADAVIAAPPLITSDVVYIGSMRSKLIALDRESGEKVWEEELGGRIKSGFAAKGNRLVILTEPRHVYMYESTTDSYALGDE